MSGEVDGVKKAADAVAPLLRFLAGLKEQVSSIGLPQEIEERETLLNALVRDLRFAAKVLDQFDSSLQGAWVQLEALLQDAREASQGGLILRPTRGPLAHPGSATRAIDTAASEMPTFPVNLLPEAVELWRLGLSLRTANRLARAGFRTLLELLVFRPVSRLKSVEGLGAAVVDEVSRVLRQRGHDPDESTAPAIALEKPTPPRRPKRGRQVVDWDSIGTTVKEALQALGGSATLTGIFQYLELPASRVKRGLLRLERQGAVSRTGTRRSTRYHLATEGDARVASPNKCQGS